RYVPEAGKPAPTGATGYVPGQRALPESTRGIPQPPSSLPPKPQPEAPTTTPPPVEAPLAKPAATAGEARPAPPKWGRRDEEGVFPLTYAGRTYRLYFDRQSATWRSDDLVGISGPGGTPVDIVGSNRDDVMRAVTSGDLGRRIDRFKPSPVQPKDAPFI